MLMNMAIMLAAVSIFMEMGLVLTMPWLRRVYDEGMFGGRIPGFWMNTIFSIALSVLLGALFAADGLVVFMASAISTVGSQILFMAYFAMERAGYDIDWFKNNWARICEQTTATALAIWKVIGFFIKVLIFPITATQWTINTFNNVRNNPTVTKITTTINNRRAS